jgi:recombinational DNA repair ATPase RecF
MALCQERGSRLPLPVDDLTTQLDPKRRQAAQRTLERFALDHQLLLATSDEELVKRASRERWHVLNLEGRQSGQSTGSEEKADAGQMHLL